MTPDPFPRGTSQNSETSANSQNFDYATWLTKQQAADAIGVSTKTIEQFAIDGKIQRALWRLHGRGAQKAVYHPDDVARVAQERRGGPVAFVLPAGVTAPGNGNGNGNGHGTGISPLSPINPLTGTAAEVASVLCSFVAALRGVSEPSENSEKWFLTIPEAAAVSGLSQAHLRRKCQDGWTGAIKDGAWKIRRKDLEAL
jgi:hypothetical protein